MYTVCINIVPKQCVRFLYTYNVNSEESGVGPDSRQVPAVILCVEAHALYTDAVSVPCRCRVGAVSCMKYTTIMMTAPGFHIFPEFIYFFNFVFRLYYIQI